jgi:hypothetical protein
MEAHVLKMTFPKDPNRKSGTHLVGPASLAGQSGKKAACCGDKKPTGRQIASEQVLQLAKVPRGRHEAPPATPQHESAE